MTLDETKALLIPLALAMRAEFDGPTQRSYAQVLSNVPAYVAQAALEQLKTTGLRFFPAATDIQAAAEKTRRQLLAVQAWTPCCECEDSPRWRKAVDPDGVTRMEKCPCVGRHQQALAERGLLAPIAALPGEAGVGENEPIFPTLAQLPAPIRQQLTEVAERKLLK